MSWRSHFFRVKIFLIADNALKESDITRNGLLFRKLANSKAAYIAFNSAVNMEQLLLSLNDLDSSVLCYAHAVPDMDFDPSVYIFKKFEYFPICL